MDDVILDVETSGALAHSDEIAALYAAAFGSESDERANFEQNFRRCVQQYTGARTVLARRGGQTVGFGYGFSFEPGHWWPDQVLPALARAGHQDWGGDSFELVELAMHPEAQGKGLGTQMLRYLQATGRHSRILLSTEPANPARALYKRAGFTELLPDFHYPATGGAAVVLGWDRASGISDPG